MSRGYLVNRFYHVTVYRDGKSVSMLSTQSMSTTTLEQLAMTIEAQRYLYPESQGYKLQVEQFTLEREVMLEDDVALVEAQYSRSQFEVKQ